MPCVVFLLETATETDPRFHQTQLRPGYSILLRTGVQTNPVGLYC